MLLHERMPSQISAFFGKVARRILVVNGHPDPGQERFCAALCDAYEQGVQAGGWEVQRLNIGTLSFSDDHFDYRAQLENAIGKLQWANQVAIAFPLRLDRPPAIVTSLFEQFAFHNFKDIEDEGLPARTIITMDMPAFAHRSLLQGDDDICALRRKINLAGLQRHTPSFIGGINTISQAQRENWLRDMHKAGLLGL